MSSQFIYTDAIINMNPLSVVTPPSIYHDCSDRKMFWEGNFAGEEKVVSAVNMKIVVVAILGNTGRSRVVTIMSSWTSH